MSRYPLADFAGVVPAMFTPFTEEGALDVKRLRGITRHLMGRGVSGLYLTGSTGEGFMMSPEERKTVVETVVDEVGGKLPLVVHVGAISTYHSAALAEHAQASGADGISAVPPIYWNFSADQIFDYYSDITGATDLPMIVYNVPMAVIGFDLLTRLATIKGVAGIKYTAVTHNEIMRLKQELGADFQIYSGADEMAVSGLAFGADGIIGSFYNVIPEVYVKLVAAMQAGRLEEAKALQATANAVIVEVQKHASMGSMKRMMAWIGADAGYVRAPHVNIIGADAEAELKARMRKLKADRGLTGVDVLDAI